MKTLLTLLAIYLSSAALHAMQSEPNAPDIEPSSSIQSIIEDYQKQLDSFKDKVKAIKVTKERMAYHEKNKPTPLKQVDEVMRLVEASPKTKPSEAGLLWTLKYGNPEQTNRAKKIIYDHYMNHQMMGMYSFWIYKKGMMAIPELQTISKDSDNINVKENAIFYEATLLNKLSIKLKDPEKNKTHKSKALELFNALLASPDLEKRNKKLYDLAKKQAESLEAK